MEEKPFVTLINSYLKKHRYLDPQIKVDPAKSLNMVIVIPSRAEPDLIRTLQSIFSAEKSARPFEVIIVFNHPDNESDENKSLNRSFLEECKTWFSDQNIDNCHVISAFNLPAKYAGVGLARKIGMDEAVERLGENSKGIIVALDADCYVEKNYLKQIEEFFAKEDKCNAASIYFEHPFDGLEEGLMNGIVQYELHLRYYNQLLRFAGHPFAFHTVGSSMAVRSEAYQKQGGMNKRKAGEDFYFLQKLIQAGGFQEINECCVYPSGRISDRVPFGTGRAQGEFLAKPNHVLSTYNPDSGMVLKEFFDIIKEHYSSELNYDALPKALVDFVGLEKLKEKLLELKSNTSNESSYILRFFQWFNLFMCFKFVHYYRDNHRENIPVSDAAHTLLKVINENVQESYSSMELLDVYRKMDRN